MKVLLYSNHQKMIEKSGVGRAIYHQKQALQNNNIPWTMNEKDEYDVVHINTIFLKSYRMSKKAKKHGKKVVYHAHSTQEDFRNSFICSNLIAPMFKYWITKCYNTADLIVTPTDYSKKLISKYKINKPIVNISNGIDTAYYEPNDEYRRRFREKYHFSEEDKIIISVGLYIERKGILEFVEMAKRMPEYKFVWFGYTNLNTVPPKIRHAVQTKLPNLFFPGYVNRDELKEAYGGADLFLFMTHEETEGIVVLEALAMRIPVLVRDIPVFDDWLMNDVNCYKANENEEFEDKIKGILTGRLESKVEEGFQVAKSRDLKEVGKQLISEYQKVCDNYYQQYRPELSPQTMK